MGHGLTTLGTAALLPNVGLGAGSQVKTGFWAKYLTALHGSVPAKQIAVFSGSTMAAAAEAKIALDGSKALRRFAHWAGEQPPAQVDED